MLEKLHPTSWFLARLAVPSPVCRPRSWGCCGGHCPQPRGPSERSRGRALLLFLCPKSATSRAPLRSHRTNCQSSARCTSLFTMSAGNSQHTGGHAPPMGHTAGKALVAGGTQPAGVGGCPPSREGVENSTWKAHRQSTWAPGPAGCWNPFNHERFVPVPWLKGSDKAAIHCSKSSMTSFCLWSKALVKIKLR